MATVFNNLMKTPSEKILDSTPRRAASFLNGIGTTPEIMKRMTDAGYSDKDHREGWHLVSKVRGFTAEGQLPRIDTPAALAVEELDAWDEQGFRRAHAALGRLHEEQDKFVFNGLQPAQGIEAVIGVKLFLDRLDALESSPDRKATHKADAAALETLSQRGFDKKERAHLRKLVKLAETTPLIPEVDDSNTDEIDAAHMDDLVELRAWFADWSETARAMIDDRRLLMRVGLAHRNKRTSKNVEEPAPPPAPSPQ